MTNDEADDPSLVGAARAGDRAALETLLNRHYPRLYALCRRLTGNDADASDACQEALLAVARGLRSYDSHSSFRTWSHRVAVNASLDELRRRRRRPEPRDLVGEHRGGGDDIEGAALRLDLDAALGRLPSEFRAAVVLRDVCGLSYAEIADVLGVPPGTVRSRIARGRWSLAGMLDPAAPGNPTGPRDRPSGER